MLNFYSIVFCIAVSIPFFDVVYTSSGKCAPSRLLAVNTCTIASKYSLVPEDQCNLKYGESGPTGKRRDGYNETDPWTVCICQGYRAVAQCYKNFCPQTDEALLYYQESETACTNVSVPLPSSNTYNPVENARNVPNFGGEKIVMSAFNSRVITAICGISFMLVVAGVL